MRRVSAGLIVVAALASFGLGVDVAGADGGKAKNEVYNASVVPQGANGRVEFGIDSSPIIFYVGTVNKKYHVLLIRVMNRSNVPLQLSRDQDSIEMEFPGGIKTNGVLNLARADAATWDGFEQEIRTAVAYPTVVPAGEEEGVYVFVPVGDVVTPRKKHQMPVVIHYKIKSLPETVDLHPRSAAAA